MNTKLRNQIYLWIFCALIGSIAGAVIWTFLKVMAVGTVFFWEWIPERINLPFYTIIFCTLGGVLIGIFRKRTGDYPEELEIVMEKVKKEKRYDYQNMLVMLIAALLPLLLGSSIGPEAGMTGVIVGLCYWAGENLKFAHHNSKEYSQIGMAVSLGLLFHSPLFGIFSVEEDKEPEKEISTNWTSKLMLYGLALGAGTGIYMLLSAVFGAGMEGFPTFPMVELTKGDYPMMVVYIICGCLLAKFYELSHHGMKSIADKLPPVVREGVGGICLGVIGTLVPMVMFSGEEQMGELMTTYVKYLPIALIGVAFLKVLLTNICIQCGLKGGHFFPVIFAGVCMGYGVATLVFAGGGGHEVFGAAIVTAALLGGIMKKPIAVTMLLFLCFPIRMFLWIFLAAAAGAKSAKV